MRWPTTLVLAVLLAALGATYYVYEVRLAPDREKRQADKGRLFAADLKDVTEVTVQRPDGTLRIKKDGDGWQLVEPVQARGDRSAIEGLVTAVTTVRMDREIEAAPGSVTDFGLDKPAADVTVTLAGGARLALQLGSKTPTGAWVYARERDKPAVVAVPDTVLRDATRPVADFRDKNVLAVDRPAVSGFEVTLGGDTVAVEHADGRWRIVRPVALDADLDTVTEFLEKLHGARVKTFVAEAPPSLAPYGLDRPARVAIHTGRDKDRSTRALLLGRVDAQEKGVYAMRPGESSVLLLPEEVWAAVPKNVAVLRNRVILELEPDKVTRIDVVGAKGPVTVVREASRWRIDAPEKLPADPVAVGTLLNKLRGLRAQGFLADEASQVSRFIPRPELRVTVVQDTAETTLLLTPSADRRGGQPSAYAAVAGRGPVVLVDARALTELGPGVLELRDRTVVSGLEPRDVKRVRARTAGQTLVLERSGDTEWRVVEPARGAAKSARVEDLLYVLRGLRWTEIVAPPGGDLAGFGLDAAGLELTLFKADGAEIATVVLGKRDGPRAYVRSGAGPAVYAIESRQLGDAPRGLDDLKG